MFAERTGGAFRAPERPALGEQARQQAIARIERRLAELECELPQFSQRAEDLRTQAGTVALAARAAAVLPEAEERLQRAEAELDQAQRKLDDLTGSSVDLGEELELGRIEADMLRYRVLDPACGSGNFLYVAYRELRRLERQLDEKRQTVSRRARRRDEMRLAFVSTKQFFSIDLRPFAVEVAKVTLMLARSLPPMSSGTSVPTCRWTTLTPISRPPTPSSRTGRRSTSASAIRHIWARATSRRRSHRTRWRPSGAPIRTSAGCRTTSPTGSAKRTTRCPTGPRGPRRYREHPLRRHARQHAGLHRRQRRHHHRGGRPSTVVRRRDG